MYKRFLLIMALAAMAVVPTQEATARTLTPAQALQRAQKAMSGTAMPVMHATSTSNATATPALTICAEGSETPAIYAFRGAAPTGGTLFVSADDATAVSVIGYTDCADTATGAFTLDQLPDELASMLASTAAEIEAVAEAEGDDSLVKVTPATSAADNLPYVIRLETPFAGGTAVSPLLTTIWGQGYPFNKKMPKLTTTGSGEHYPVSGCVPVAMAQVMNFWEYPAHGTGTVSTDYTQNVTDNKTDQLVLDNLNFDWANMINDYGKATSSTDYSNAKGTDTEQAAVADLMHACALSVKAKFNKTSTDASGSRMVNALVNNFHYDPCMRLYHLDYFTQDSIQKRLYANLAAGRPCLFVGNHANQTAKTSVGHAFVLDGFDGTATKCWHFNFGWNTARSTSANWTTGFYYTLSQINPDSHSTNTVSEVRDFVYNRFVILDIKPLYDASGAKDMDGTPTGERMPLSAAVLKYKATSSFEYAPYPSGEEPLSFTISDVDGHKQLHMLCDDLDESPVYSSQSELKNTIYYGAMVEDKFGATMWFDAKNNAETGPAKFTVGNDSYDYGGWHKKCNISSLVSRVAEKNADELTYAIYLGQHTDGQTDYRRVRNAIDQPQCVVARTLRDGTVTYSHPRDLQFIASGLPPVIDNDGNYVKDGNDQNNQALLYNARPSAKSDSTYYIMRFNAMRLADEEDGEYATAAVSSNSASSALSDNTNNTDDVYSLVAVGVFEQDATNTNLYTLVKSGPMVPVYVPCDEEFHLRRFPNYPMPNVDMSNGRRYYILYNQDGTMLYGPVAATYAITTGIESIRTEEQNETGAPAVYYNLQGMRMPENALTPGIYIRRQGTRATKVIVK